MAEVKLRPNKSTPRFSPVLTRKYSIDVFVKYRMAEAKLRPNKGRKFIVGTFRPSRDEIWLDICFYQHDVASRHMPYRMAEAKLSPNKRG